MNNFPFKSFFGLTFAVFLGSFQVFAQSIRVLSPNGGESWEATSSKIIRWESENVTKVKIEYSLDNGLSWGTISISQDASSGQYIWTTANAHTPYALIKISDAINSNVFSISDANFSLSLTKEKLTKKETSQNPIKIMPLGDSITWGVNPDDANSPGYRRDLYNLLNNAGYYFDLVGSLSGGLPNDFDRDNEGHPGWEARRDADETKSLYHHLTDFLEDNQPDIILLHIGTNDLSPLSSDPAQLADEVKDLLDVIDANPNNIITFLAKIIDRADNETKHNNTVEFNTIELPKMINSLPSSQQDKIFVVDMYSNLGLYFGTPTGLNPNFTHGNDNLHLLHPNTNGYSVMANAWYNELVNILPIPPTYADLKVFLQGPYNSGYMNTTLNTGTYLKSYALNQPYNVDPWGYSGSEIVDSFFFTNNPSIVDWILVELRDKTDPGSIITSRAGFIKNDGSIVDTNGIEKLSFVNASPDSYYISIKHRNHLGVMSANPVMTIDKTLTYDFTSGAEKFYGVESTAKLFEYDSSEIWGMIAGDGNGDGLINLEDLEQVWRLQNGFDNYSNADYNLDGYINALDKNFYWRLNEGSNSQIP